MITTEQKTSAIDALFSFPTPYEGVKDKETGLKIRMFYEGESGCLSIEAGDCGTYYQDVSFGGSSTGPCTLVISKNLNRYGLKVYSEPYRPFHDLDDKMKPVFEWERDCWGYMMALKDFMGHWPYEHIGKMSFA